jgi:hypothetical protein
VESGRAGPFPPHKRSVGSGIKPPSSPFPPTQLLLRARTKPEAARSARRPPCASLEMHIARPPRAHTFALPAPRRSARRWGAIGVVVRVRLRVFARTALPLAGGAGPRL